MDGTTNDIKILVDFKDTVRTYYEHSGRHDLPWRQPITDGVFDPYRILVSELMLQQTQVPRVIPKYTAFIAQFPDIQTLANATLGDVLRLWSGLGYNRRAKYLHDSARLLSVNDAFPRDIEGLIQLPGVGRNTAGAIMAYAYNSPDTFIETNIRSVYLYHFFKDDQNVPDRAVLELVDQTMDRVNPRTWYWSLMDYGTMLKITDKRINRSSASYVKQSDFNGSKRQIRGQVLQLLSNQNYTNSAMRQFIGDARLQSILKELKREGLIVARGHTYSLE